MIEVSTMDPNDIAEWVSNDRSKNLIVESLFGYRVNAGSSQIDRFILMIDQAFVDWDLKNKKFIDLANKFFGKIPSVQEWEKLIENSNQSPELKEKLIALLSSKDVTTQGPRDIIIHHKDPNIGQIRVSDIRDSGKDYFYCAVGKPGSYIRWVRGGWGKWRSVAKDWFFGYISNNTTKYLQKYSKIITVKKANIIKIDNL